MLRLSVKIRRVLPQGAARNMLYYIRQLRRFILGMRAIDRKQSAPVYTPSLGCVEWLIEITLKSIFSEYKSIRDEMLTNITRITWPYYKMYIVQLQNTPHQHISSLITNTGC